MLFLLVAIISVHFGLFDYNGIIGSGQSLSIGGRAGSQYTSTQPYGNLKLSLGSKDKSWPLDPNDRRFSLVPLVEPLRPITKGYPTAYPKNIHGESPHTSMSIQISCSNPNVLTVHTAVGEDGMGMDRLRRGAEDDGKTGRAYNASLFEIQAINRLAKNAGKTYGVSAIVLTHGEANAWLSSYQNDLVQFYKNYSEDARRLTNQTESPVLIVSQQHSSRKRAIPLSTLAQWKAQEDVPGGIFCAGTKYQYEYINDGTHMLQSGYIELGEKYGEVFTEVVVKGNKDWRPLQPISAVLIDAYTVNVTFNVPNPPLQWDTNLPPPVSRDEWLEGKGFELSAGPDVFKIAGVEIEGNSVLITAEPRLISYADTLKVGYAATAQPERINGVIQPEPPEEIDDDEEHSDQCINEQAGDPSSGSGLWGGVFGLGKKKDKKKKDGKKKEKPRRPGGTTRWGLLKDSDATVGCTSGKLLRNWALSFEMSVE